MRFPSIISRSVIIAAKNASIHQTNNIVRRFVQSATMKSAAATSMPIQSIHVQPQSQLQQQQKQQFRYATSSGRRGRRRRHKGGEIVEELQSNNGICLFSSKTIKLLYKVKAPIYSSSVHGHLLLLLFPPTCSLLFKLYL